jgi:branched-chain amino acid transport system ATP-binding protein
VSAALSVRGLVAGYGGIRVLHGVDLDVADGAVTAVVGPNGAGKTTLLRAVSGLVPCTGEIALNGAPRPPSPAAIVAAGVAHVAEGRALFPHMTVRENLELGAWCLARRARGARLDEMLATFPRLAERRGQLAGSLSGGEQQMLAIARALMSRPRLLLLDEPSLGLAPRMVDDVLRMVAALPSAGVTVLLVEQNVGAALAIAAAAYVMERGRVVLSGTGRGLLSSEAVRAAYLGTVRGGGASA